MNHDIKGCKDVGQCGSNHPFVPEGNLFWKLINITFAYLLNSTILQNLKKKLYSVQIWLKVGPNCPFSSRDILWENWLSLFCAYCVPSYYNISKKSQRANHQTRFHNFGPNWAWVAPSTKRKFIGNIGHHCINLLYPIMLHNFKKILREQILRLHNFCPNCSSWKID